jgi:hypothetical protein
MFTVDSSDAFDSIDWAAFEVLEAIYDVIIELEVLSC